LTPSLAQAVGRTVRVTTVDGLTRKGRLTATAPTTIAVDGDPVSLKNVATVEKVSHRVRNGMLIGLTTGLVLGLGATIACGDEGECDPTPVAVLGGIGAGVGAGIGALMNIGDKDLLFKAGKRTTSFAIAPIVSPTRKGVAFRVSWR